MKKLFYLSLLFPLFISSCSSDDDWEDVNANNLIGRWQISDVYTKVVNTNLPELTEELKVVTLTSTPIIEFREGGVFISGDGKAGEYYIDGKTIYMKIDDSYYEQFDNASIKGNSLQWDSDMKNQIQISINNQYPYENIIVYDYVVTMKADRK